jgi:hypothetical protein
MAIFSIQPAHLSTFFVSDMFPPAISRANFSALAAQTLEPATYRVEQVSLIDSCPLRSSRDDTFDLWMKAVYIKATAVIRLVLKKNTGLSSKSIKEDVRALKDGEEVMGEVDLLNVTSTELDNMPSRGKPKVHADTVRRSGRSRK